MRHFIWVFTVCQSTRLLVLVFKELKVITTVLVALRVGRTSLCPQILCWCYTKSCIFVFQSILDSNQKAIIRLKVAPDLCGKITLCFIKERVILIFVQVLAFSKFFSSFINKSLCPCTYFYHWDQPNPSMGSSDTKNMRNMANSEDPD